MENVGLMVALAGAMTKAPTAEQVSTAVDAWLDDHPEATTTVTDGSITNAKLASSFVTPGTAAAYSSSATYAVGDYVFYGGSLYRCTTAITTAEAWTAAHWTAAVLGNDVSDLKNDLDLISEPSPNILFFTNTTDREGSGISLVFDGDDTVTINGSPTGNILLWLMGDTSKNGTHFPAGTYYVNANIVSGTHEGSFSFRWGTALTTWRVGQVHTSETDSAISIRLAEGATFNNCKIQFWITEGDAITEYTKHGDYTANDKVAREEIGNIKVSILSIESDVDELQSLVGADLSTEIGTEAGQSKISTLANLNKSANKLNFAWVTDIHNSVTGMRDCISTVNAIVEYGQIDMLINGGDYLANNATTTDYDTMIGQLQNMKKIIDFAKVDCKTALIGNHDGDYGYIYPADLKWRFLDHFNRNDGIVLHESGAFYKDYDSVKCRVIGLNCSDFPTNADGAWSIVPQYSFIFSAEQLKWLAEEALGNITESGWTVLFFAHTALTTEVTSEYTTSNYVAVRNGSVLESIMLARKNCTTYTKEGEERVTVYNGDTYPQITLNYDIDVDYSALPSINIAGYIYGHVHADHLITVNGVTYVSTDNASDSDKTSGTIAETAMDIVTLDPTNRTVTMNRIGAGSDRSFTY